MRGNRTKRQYVPQPRDLQLLREITVLRNVDREQAQIIAGFGSPTRAKTRLLKLVKIGLLNRFFISTEKGGKKSIYTSSEKSARLLQIPFTGLLRKANQLVLGDLFVNHQLHINEIYIALKHKNTRSDVQLLEWRGFQEKLTSSSPIIPDAYFELSTPRMQVSVFLEVDLGTETAKTWKIKIESYLKLAVTGEFEKRFNRPQFRILVIVNSAPRMHRLRLLVETFTDKIFWFSTFEQIRQSGFWSPIWLRPSGGQPQPFVEGLL